jgi:hypothetical protein
VAVATVLAQAQLKYAEPSGRQSCCETVPSAPDSSHACLSLKTSHACVCSNKTQPAPSPQHSLSVSQCGPSTRHDDAAHDLDKATRRAHAHEQLRAAIGSQTSDGDAVGLHRQGRSHPLSPPVHAPGGGGTHACVPASPEAHAQSRTDCTAQHTKIYRPAQPNCGHGCTAWCRRRRRRHYRLLSFRGYLVTLLVLCSVYIILRGAPVAHPRKAQRGPAHCRRARPRAARTIAVANFDPNAHAKLQRPAT